MKNSSHCIPRLSRVPRCVALAGCGSARATRESK